MTAREGFEQPVYYWDPVIAPSGAQFYTGTAFPGVARQSLHRQPRTRLVRLIIDNGRVTGEEHLLADRGQRVRDVKQGPDGALYVVTDEDKASSGKSPREDSDTASIPRSSVTIFTS